IETGSGVASTPFVKPDATAYVAGAQATPDTSPAPDVSTPEPSFGAAPAFTEPAPLPLPVETTPTTEVAAPAGGTFATPNKTFVGSGLPAKHKKGGLFGHLEFP